MSKKDLHNFTPTEKQLIISLINDYRLFNGTDQEIMDYIAIKLERRISRDTYYRLKKEADKKQMETGVWFNYFTRYPIVDHYMKRIEEVTYVQRGILEIFAELRLGSLKYDL